MHFLGAKYDKNAFAVGALPWIPLGGAYVLPQTPAAFKGPTSKGREWQGKKGEGRAREMKGWRKGKGKGEEKGHTGTSFSPL